MTGSMNSGADAGGARNLKVRQPVPSNVGSPHCPALTCAGNLLFSRSDESARGRRHEGGYRTHSPRLWWALALLCGAFFMVILDRAIVTVALPSIEKQLDFSAQGLQWVVSAYALTFPCLPLLGRRAAALPGRRP